MSKLFICGDMHGSSWDTKKINKKNWIGSEKLTEDDVLIQLGDFGWVWHPLGENKEQEYNLDMLAGKNWTLAVVPGNHENYDELDNLPLEQKWGGQVRVLKRSNSKKGFKDGVIYFLERGGVYTINNKKIWVMGGALSIDKESRIEGVTYWSRELLSYADECKGLISLENNNYEFDYILTHTCPNTILKEVLGIDYIDHPKYHDPTSQYLDHVLDNLKNFKEWHFGHFHKDALKEVDGKIFGCHYLNTPYELK